MNKEWQQQAMVQECIVLEDAKKTYKGKWTKEI